jgi:hypothetical protein
VADNKNYGSFLNEFKKPGPGSRGTTLDTRKADAVGNLDTKSQGFVRDRSSRRAREGDQDSISNVDAVSHGSRGVNFGQYAASPSKLGGQTFSQGDEYTNRTQG